MYLPVATREDMTIIAHTLMEQYHVHPSEKDLEQIIQVSGGYVQYLQYALMHLHDAGDKKKKDSLLEDLSADEQIVFQSEELFDSLTKVEKDTLVHLRQDGNIPSDGKDKARYLWHTGIVHGDQTTTEIFSPLFASYIASLSLNLQLGKDFTKKEFALFTYLESRVGQLCEREAIIETVWPESHEMGVSDWAVDRLVARLRSKLKAQQSHYQIETVVTRGYKLIKQ